MTRRNNIVMIRRENPKRLVLPNDRTFYAKYRRATQDELPANVRIRRCYKQRAAPWGRRRRRPGRQGRRAFKSFFKKGLNFAKKAYNNKSVRYVARALISEAPGAIEGLSKKVKNKKLQKILSSDIARIVVDLPTGFALDKLQ